MAVKTHRAVAFSDLVFDQGAFVELLGPGCDDDWARQACSSGLALGGAQVTFKRPGDTSALVRMSRAQRKASEARPEHVRVVLRGDELRRWPVPKMTGGIPVVLLPGDSLTITL